MIRTLTTLCATLAMCFVLGGCNGGAGDDAPPKANKRRPVPEVKKAPGPDMSGNGGGIEKTDRSGQEGGGG